MLSISDFFVRSHTTFFTNGAPILCLVLQIYLFKIVQFFPVQVSDPIIILFAPCFGKIFSDCLTFVMTSRCSFLVIFDCLQS